jgi:hypothetical protein
MGLEPTRAEHIGLAVQRLNHSATSSMRKIGKCAIVVWKNPCPWSKVSRYAKSEQFSTSVPI